jgi:hypothetical protein
MAEDKVKKQDHAVCPPLLHMNVTDRQTARIAGRDDHHYTPDYLGTAGQSHLR